MSVGTENAEISVEVGWWRWMRSLIVCMGGALILELLIIARDEVTLDAGR